MYPSVCVPVKCTLQSKVIKPIENLACLIGTTRSFGIAIVKMFQEKVVCMQLNSCFKNTWQSVVVSNTSILIMLEGSGMFM